MLFDQPERRPATREIAETTRLVPFERHLSAIRWQFRRGVLIGIVLSAALAIPAFKYSRRRDGPSLPKVSGQTTPGNSDMPAALRAPKDTASESFPLAAQPKPQVSTQPNHFADGRVKPAVAGDRAKSSAPFPVSQPVPLSDASFTKPEPTKKTLATLAQLWALVETGDTKAAVALADIYLRGEGVPVNCEQARILLFVASKENNAEATRKLQDLDATGCPAP